MGNYSITGFKVLLQVHQLILVPSTNNEPLHMTQWATTSPQEATTSWSLNGPLHLSNEPLNLQLMSHHIFNYETSQIQQWATTCPSMRQIFPTMSHISPSMSHLISNNEANISYNEPYISDNEPPSHLQQWATTDKKKSHGKSNNEPPQNH